MYIANELYSASQNFYSPTISFHANKILMLRVEKINQYYQKFCDIF